MGNLGAKTSLQQQHQQQQLSKSAPNPLTFRNNSNPTHRIKCLVIGSDTNHQDGVNLISEMLNNAAVQQEERDCICVTQYNASKKAPSAELLAEHDVVLVDTFSGVFEQFDKLGNVLADYVDLGGGVVCCAATNCLAWDKCVVHGRFEMGNYHPLLYGYKYLNSGISQTPHAKILAPLHPIFYRVKKPFSGGSWAGHVECKVDPRSLLIAQWCNGNPLIAERAIGEARVVALNFGAISSAIGVSDYWSPEDTDNHLIIYNAVKYASKLKIRDWRATLFTIWTTRKRSYTDVIICN